MLHKRGNFVVVHTCDLTKVNSLKMERFASSTAEDIGSLLANKDAESTKKATNQATKVLREYCMEKNISPAFEQLNKTELDKLLGQFYANARRKDGTLYTKSTMNSLRYGLARYFQSENNVDFASSNKVFAAFLVDLKRNGLAKVNHHPDIAADDLHKLYSNFNLDTPKSLQQKVLFDILFHLVRRGRENLRQQSKDSFKVAIDSQNRKYVYQAIDELDKNHREKDDPSDSTTDGRMYEQPGELCPVKSFQLYLSKLHPELDSLWQRPKEAVPTDSTDNVWYCKVPVGKNTLGNFMKNISRAAGLSKEYTNHSIRATAVTLLDHSNFEARHIMRVSGHKSEASIRSYSRRLSESKQKAISDTLGQACGLTSETTRETEKGVPVSPELARLTSSQRERVHELDSPCLSHEPGALQLTSSQYEHELEALCTSPLPRASLPGSPVFHATQTNTLKNVTFASGAFSNCNVTFNFTSN